MSQIDSVCVVGLGKLGAAMAAAIASRDFQVTGVDLNPAAVEAVNQGRAPVQETGLDELIAGQGCRLSATRDIGSAVAGSDLSFIIVPTPSDESGGFALDYAAAACRDVGHGLAGTEGYHLVVMTSTVMPGACREILVPAIEAASGKTAGRDFGFCYSPEFIALGSAIHDFLNPDFTLVGAWDRRSGFALERFYERLLENPAPCQVMALENAELAKIALNSYVTTKITFANSLAEICTRLPGGDVDAVTTAIGCDKRIGKRYLTGGLGFGGPCFPRDNVAFDLVARRLGVEDCLALQTDRLNAMWLNYHLERIQALTNRGARIAVLGLTYKPKSSVIEQSQGLVLAQRLAASGFHVVGYDPLPSSELERACEGSIELVGSLPEALSRARSVVVTAPEGCYRALGPADLDLQSGPVCVYDLWRCCQASLDGHPGILYQGFGRGPAPDRIAEADQVVSGAAE